MFSPTPEDFLTAVEVDGDSGDGLRGADIVGGRRSR